MEFHVLWQSTRQNRNNSFQYSLKELSEIDKVARSIFLFTSKLLLYFYWMKKIIFIPINLTVIIYMYMYCQSGVRCMYVLFLNYTNYIIKNHIPTMCMKPKALEFILNQRPSQFHSLLQYVYWYMFYTHFSFSCQISDTNYN